jgi:hypothetical protein
VGSYSKERLAEAHYLPRERAGKKNRFPGNGRTVNVDLLGKGRDRRGLVGAKACPGPVMRLRRDNDRSWLNTVLVLTRTGGLLFPASLSFMFVMNTEDTFWPLRVLKENKAPGLDQGMGRF